MDEVLRLAAEIQRHDRLYWEQDQPEISDQAYDALVEELRRHAPDHPLLSRLQNAPQLDLFAAKDQSHEARFGQAVTHQHPMLSLAKAYDLEEVSKWFAGFDGGALVMPKIDGIACSVRYAADGSLDRAATRGNGRSGEDISANIIASACVPLTIDAHLAPVEVRGEVYIPLQAFKKHLASRFSNPRNTAAGALKQKDHPSTAGYHLRFFAYELIADDAPDEDEKLQRLDRMGFEPINKRLCDHDEDVTQAIEHYSAIRDELPYETDGVVARALLASEQRRLGHTAHHPRFAMAFKFSGDVAETELVAVEWQVARTGTITPVAQLEAVELSGAMVSRASLHHAGRVEALALALPARVLAARRGGVIPHVEAVVRQGEERVALPSHCPGCGSETRRQDDFLLCGDPDQCRPARIARLIHWARAFEVEGLGQKLAEMLHDEGLAQAPIDLYQLNRDALVELPRMAEKSADNILQQIEASRHRTSAQFLVALGIDDLGVTVAERLLSDLGQLETLRDADVERLLRIDGVGDIMARGIHAALNERRDEIDALLAVLDLQEASSNPSPSGFLDGYWVVFTGTLEASDRKSAQGNARQQGAQTPSQVLSQDQGLLVVGDRNSALLDNGRVSSKHAKARTLIRKGVDLLILSETEWLDLCAGTIRLEDLRKQWAQQAR